MSSMQMFHNELFSDRSSADEYTKSLATVSRASLEEMAALENDLAWTSWGVDEDTQS
ncbi:MAG: hypothetical protein OEZ02_01375 [Anaerolineae bacterium]|nr:hypothetical protein [Anaerolineae bacterium]